MTRAADVTALARGLCALDGRGSLVLAGGAKALAGEPAAVEWERVPLGLRGPSKYVTFVAKLSGEAGTNTLMLLGSLDFPAPAAILRGPLALGLRISEPS